MAQIGGAANQSYCGGREIEQLLLARR